MLHWLFLAVGCGHHHPLVLTDQLHYYITYTSDCVRYGPQKTTLANVDLKVNYCSCLLAPTSHTCVKCCSSPQNIFREFISPPEVDLVINVTLVYILIIAMSTSATADTAILCKLPIAVKIFNLVYILCCPQFTCSFLLRLSFLSLSRLIRFPLPSSVSLCIPENLSRGHSKCYRCILYGLRY